MTSLPVCVPDQIHPPTHSIARTRTHARTHPPTHLVYQYTDQGLLVIYQLLNLLEHFHDKFATLVTNNQEHNVHVHATLLGLLNGFPTIFVVCIIMYCMPVSEHFHGGTILPFQIYNIWGNFVPW